MIIDSFEALKEFVLNTPGRSVYYVENGRPHLWVEKEFDKILGKQDPEWPGALQFVGAIIIEDDFHCEDYLIVCTEKDEIPIIQALAKF